MSGLIDAVRRGPLHVLAARGVLAGLMLIVGLGRLGLYTYRSGTLTPKWVYGIGLVAAASGLVLTGGCRAHRLPARLCAALGAAVLLGLAVDVSVRSQTILGTSQLTLFWLTIVALVEVTARHECE